MNTLGSVESFNFKSRGAARRIEQHFKVFEKAISTQNARQWKFVAETWPNVGSDTAEGINMCSESYITLA